MLECCQTSPAEGEEMFCFDEDDQFLHQMGKKNSDFHSSSQSQDANQVNFKFDPSRLPNFENEEILSIRPQKNFSFDIMQQAHPQQGEWEPSARRVINSKSEFNFQLYKYTLPWSGYTFHFLLQIIIIGYLTFFLTSASVLSI